MSGAPRELARAMHRHLRSATQAGRTTFRGEVTDIDPLTIDLLERDATLSEEDFDLSATVLAHVVVNPWALGDNVVLIDDGDVYLVIDVISDDETPETLTASPEARLAALEATVEALTARITDLEGSGAAPAPRQGTVT